MNSLILWTLVYVVMILGMFYFLYRTIKTKNVKYAYAIGGMLILMIGMFFL